MLLRSASTPVLKYGGGRRFLNRPTSVPALPVTNIGRTISDGNLKLGNKNLVPIPTGPPVKEEAAGGGGGNFGGGGFNGGGDWGRGRDKLEEYYKEMIKLYPGDSLLLTNYAKYLKDVRGDMVKAEEYCGRAILMNATGDVFSMYAELIWRNHGDADRAQTYFEQAKKASPNDSFVHAAYARFLWDAGVEEEEEEEEEEEDEFRYPAISSFSQTDFSQDHSIPTAS